MSEPVGADIESICGKCGDVWHVVVAKVGDKIAKVLCKQCGAQHRHKPPGGAPAATRSKARTGTTRKSRKKAAPPPVEFDPSKPPLPYRTTAVFAVGDRVDHAKFGVGVVAEIPGPGKMEVVFDDKRRLLVQGQVG